MGRPAFILIDKPKGWTSHDVVAKLRRVLGMKKVGHAGTLDPMATGLLVVALDRATRLLRFVQHRPKTYIATAVFGVATDSLDADGSVLSREPMPVSLAEIEAVVPRFRGDIHQIPPMVSAVKVAGKRLYELARAGEEVEREARPVTVYELDVIEFAPSDYPEVTFRVRCSTGTYVRTLADDVARALGGRAHLTALRRIANGSLSVEDAHTVDAIVAAADAGSVENLILDPAVVLEDLPAVVVDSVTGHGVRNGVPISGRLAAEAGVDEGPVRILDESGALLAVYRAAGGKLMADVVIA